MALQDGRLPARAEAAYRRALALRPDLAEAEANLGVVLQEQGDLDAAKQAYGRAINLMPSAFGRVAQALTTAPKGELWIDLAEPARSLVGTRPLAPVVAAIDAGRRVQRIGDVVVGVDMCAGVIVSKLSVSGFARDRKTLRDRRSAPAARR